MDIFNAWNIITYIIFDIPLIRDVILDNLCASDCASLLALANYDLSSHDIKKFLHPIRDIFDDESTLQYFTTTTDIVVLIGKDLDLLLLRITDPLRFWKLVPLSMPIDVFTVSIRPLSSSRCQEWQQSSSVVSEHPNDTQLSYQWKTRKSQNGSNVNRLRCVHSSNYPRCIWFTIGVSWYIEVTREYTGMIPIYDDTAMCLVSCAHDKHYTTRYIDLSNDPYEAKLVSDTKLPEEIKNRYRHIKLEVYHEDCKEYGDCSIIEFPIGKESIVPSC